MKIKIHNLNETIEVDPQTPILECLLQSEIDIDHSCGGNGTCGTCRIFIQSGSEKLEPRNEIESEMAEDRKFFPNERLSCQTLPVEGLVIEIKNRGN